MKREKSIASELKKLNPEFHRFLTVDFPHVPKSVRRDIVMMVKNADVGQASKRSEEPKVSW